MSFDRRQFIKGGLSAATIGATAWLGNLSAIADAAAQSVDPASDYRALVCIFLMGGSDQHNMLIPVASNSYPTYSASRPTCGIKLDALQYLDGKEFNPTPTPTGLGLPTSLSTASALTLASYGNSSIPNVGTHNCYALHPGLTSLKSLYDAGILAPVLNVGPLEAPCFGYKDAYGNVSLKMPDSTGIYPDPALDVAFPPQLGSHNDQQIYWQSMGVEGSTSGWGGRLIEKSAVVNTTQDLASISVSPGSVWGEGSALISYPVQPNTQIQNSWNSLISTRLAAFAGAIMKGYELSSNGVRGTDYSSTGHLLAQDLSSTYTKYQNIVSSVKTADTFSDSEKRALYPRLYALAEAGALPIDRNGLAAQLLSVIHEIKVGQSMANKPQRQVFFVTLGGFDTHQSYAGIHEKLMQHLGQAMFCFQKTLQDLGLANNVTTFTASEFGRTLSANGAGTDHGWGGHHLVMGGAVLGGTIYGSPSILGDKATSWGRLSASKGKVEDIGRGRLIPTISTTQYAATFAKWMGVTDANMPLVVRNFAKFNAPVTTTNIETVVGWQPYLRFLG